MKMLIVCLTLFFANSVANAADQSKNNLSIDEIRDQLVNKEVIIRGVNFYASTRNNVLNEWNKVEGSEFAGYKIIRSTPQPIELLGKRGLVVAVIGTSYKNVVEQTDTSGKVIEPVKIVNPYVKLIVKLNDDSLIGAEGKYKSMVGEVFQPAQGYELFKKEIETSVSRLIGKNLYNVRQTKILPSDLTTRELIDHDNREYRQIVEDDNLIPMKLINVKVLDEQPSIVLKVELPNSETRILYGSLSNYENTDSQQKRSLLERIGINAFEKIPSNLTKREISSIKEKSAFKGMSATAVMYSIGLPEKTNDWGNGGEQWIYKGGTYIYLKNNTVQDWQHIE